MQALAISDIKIAHFLGEFGLFFPLRNFSTTEHLPRYHHLRRGDHADLATVIEYSFLLCHRQLVRPSCCASRKSSFHSVEYLRESSLHRVFLSLWAEPVEGDCDARR